MREVSMVRYASCDIVSVSFGARENEGADGRHLQPGP
jgi:hypothetical protein